VVVLPPVPPAAPPLPVPPPLPPPPSVLFDELLQAAAPATAEPISVKVRTKNSFRFIELASMGGLLRLFTLRRYPPTLA